MFEIISLNLIKYFNFDYFIIKIEAVEGEDYTNSICFEGVRHGLAFIIAESPLLESISKFWSLMFVYSTQLIINLGKEFLVN